MSYLQHLAHSEETSTEVVLDQLCQRREPAEVLSARLQDYRHQIQSDVQQ